MFHDIEYRFGAFAAAVALVLVLALTAMAFNALQPERRAASNWDISLSETPVAIPGLAN